MFSANQIAGFFNQSYLQNKLMKQFDFFHVDTNSQKLKVFWVGMVKNWCGQSGHRTVKLTASQKCTYGANMFLMLV